jgi:predicted ATP-dependent endonuclease of OLD family
LIDELERHLHYDAQADVIQVFSKQQALPQIIYSTHSAGCLPEDLGTGVRLVGPIEGTNHSRIQNRFWTSGEGFSPLLVGMGAAALAFVPVRNAVMSEGATEIVLLPTLMRQALGERAVGFQIAPASSEAPAARIGGLDAEGAPEVAWLVDGDEGGRALRRRLRRAGVPDDRIVPLAGARSEKVLEDLVRADAYVRAFNEELRRSGHEVEISASAIDGVNRPRRAAAWCRARKIEPPSKPNVAYRLVEFAREGDELLNSSGRKSVRGLHKQLEKIFKDKPAPPEETVV